MTGRWVRPAAVAASVAVGAVAAAHATLAGGGRNLRSAPLIGPDRTVRGRMFDEALAAGYSGAFYRIGLVRGDRVTIRARSEDSTTPCQTIFLPSVKESMFQVLGGPEALKLAPKSQHPGARPVQTWVATRTGLHVVVVNNMDLASIHRVDWRSVRSVTKNDLLSRAKAAV